MTLLTYFWCCSYCINNIFPCFSEFVPAENLPWGDWRDLLQCDSPWALGEGQSQDLRPNWNVWGGEWSHPQKGLFCPFFVLAFLVFLFSVLFPFFSVSSSLCYFHSLYFSCENQGNCEILAPKKKKKQKLVLWFAATEINNLLISWLLKNTSMNLVCKL